MSLLPGTRTLSHWRVSGAVAACLTLVSALAGCGPGSTPQPNDSTPPEVASNVPAAGDDNVWVGQPIAVTFSEPLDPGTVNDTSVQLAGSGSVDIAKTLALTGNTLTVTPVSTLDLPQTLTLSLTAGIQDLAGNPLEPATWSWTVPSWLRLGDDPVLTYTGDSFVYWPHLALDTHDRPVVAGNREESPQALLRRWDGTAWVDIPPPNGADGSGYIHDLAMAVDDPVVAWSGRFEDGPDSDFYVSRWDGEAWTLLGGGLKVGDVIPEEAALAVTSSGLPVIAFSQKAMGGNSPADLLVKRWTGTTWQALGAKLDVNDGAAIQDIDIVLDGDDDPIVSWGERFFDVSFVKAWDPTLQTWQLLGGAISTSEQAPAMVVRAGGELVAADNASDQTIRLFRYAAPNWVPLGPALRRDESRTTTDPSLIENAAGEVMVGWSEIGAAGSSVEVATLRAGAWVFTEDAITISAPSGLSNVSLGLLDGATPVVVYTLFRPHDVGFEFDNETRFRQHNE